MSTAPAIEASLAALVENIRHFLKDRDIKHYEMAVTLGMSPDEFSQRMTGKVPFDVVDLLAIGGELEVQVLDLLDDTGL